MTQEIDKIPVKDLQTRYNIGRTALYERIKHANIKPSKEGTRSFISGEQLKELDRLNDYLMTGRTFEDFEPLLTEEFTEDSQETISLDSSPNSSPNSSPDVHRTGSWEAEREALEVLIDAIASGIERANINKMQPLSPIEYMHQLKIAAQEQWLLTTSEVRELIKVKPHTRKGEDTYRRGSWLFVKSGKIGRETAWRVEQETGDKRR
ncbi:MAG: hypothetical protein F6K50_02935 [Moorea sp. SIO3I7]|uniref:hypothetical protein n=1 Tax=Moorena sp. SIO3I8 TaxID=2607833 RepID=UPI0013BF5469|nr:hypothetical protein [Moorena sp. SIO3I8]NEN94518.1 hypothetical protein [Moorena sp. SIO3I7]NEO09265.1 hypothetical protein [Moorena sp. SIO3I8]